MPAGGISTRKRWSWSRLARQKVDYVEWCDKKSEPPRSGSNSMVGRFFLDQTSEVRHTAATFKAVFPRRDRLTDGAAYRQARQGVASPNAPGHARARSRRLLRTTGDRLTVAP